MSLGLDGRVDKRIVTESLDVAFVICHSRFCECRQPIELRLRLQVGAKVEENSLTQWPIQCFYCAVFFHQRPCHSINRMEI